MNDFKKQDLQLIAFLCMQRQNIVGIDQCEEEGTTDIYRKTCSQLREDNDE